MTERLADLVQDRITEATGLFYRLVLVVAPSRSGKTAGLQHIARRAGYPLLNVNLELARRLLELTERQRALQTPQILEDLVAGTRSDVVLLDNLEILFDRRLQQEPLRCLQRLSRHRTVVAAWNGKPDGGGNRPLTISYAVPGHPESVRYPVEDFLVADPTESAGE
jgi:hypothetical protein